ncbi:MAG: efflux RND transporter periplasmic adaptor subunit [Mesorhizobium sp.]|uniref:efflux RND transporter periplasmic adaptor subunit n=2 Tax=unclassified Mesorhizobium TaxID=325217 RepID=UPI000FE8D258|nr:efflux RND transporter periplasmic adaptor subunit [Mesorhizobium sp.]RWC44495.1 MAG: efflux RND transporter periplasmic adaptor subunit [Mesorhizobium sp.]RWD45535.1 MAG: efflux RND transporter periplasmic adaptor subunit [Mesorhizobium sp.]RWE09018.1 MAG: efflux RND transporter periplasmic adaptor subunit [Mesorhizobium sp.]RWE54464.1 MAG: efflux RND transporter periplasmic adaptor subunit [Mesorhizobium sp.]RWE87090.1 MAG: efflux RND transporter periplasmic adaptor subunit [Mesorhizobium
MPKYRFHKLAAIVVLVGFAAWMVTGEFSSVGSAAADNEPKAGEVEQPKAADASKAKPSEAEQPKAPLRTVATITPPRRTYARAIRISGLTEADKRAVLATRVAGVIDKLPVKQGQRVKTGDLVLMLAAEEKLSAVSNAKQLLVQRQAELDAALRLAKTGNLPKLQLDTARSNLTSAQALLETAQAELDRNEVKAPFDGVIDRVPVELGSSVMQGGEVATILSLDPVIARGEVSERDLGYLKIGDKANVRLVSGQNVEGTVRYISRDASSATRTFRVEIAIPNPEGTIPAGMTAEIALSAQPTDAVILPRSVVTLGDKGDLGIRAVDKHDKVVFFPIDLVDDTPTGLVLGGIPADARIIVAGQELVKEGEVVKPVEADRATIQKLLGEATAGTQ